MGWRKAGSWSRCARAGAGAGAGSGCRAGEEIVGYRTSLGMEAKQSGVRKGWSRQRQIQGNGVVVALWSESTMVRRPPLYGPGGRRGERTVIRSVANTDTTSNMHSVVHIEYVIVRVPSRHVY